MWRAREGTPGRLKNPGGRPAPHIDYFGSTTPRTRTTDATRTSSSPKAHDLEPLKQAPGIEGARSGSSIKCRGVQQVAHRVGHLNAEPGDTPVTGSMNATALPMYWRYASRVLGLDGISNSVDGKKSVTRQGHGR